MRASTSRRLGALTALSGLALVVSASVAGSASAATAPVVTKQLGVNGCNGVITTPGSENTSKTLVGGSMQPGEVALFEIAYPVDAADIGQTFKITDCVFVGGVSAEKYLITFVPNNTSYTLEYAVTIPDDAPIGVEYCNYAKTTSSPSASQASNRKANPACFNVGGSLRVEKHDENGALLPGAQFEVACDPQSQVPPVVVDGLDEDGIATTGAIGINGPEGTQCEVTEVAAPEGYDLADDASRTLTIPRGSEATTEVFVNMPTEVEPSETPSIEPTEEPTVEPTVEPSDPEPSISPTVLGVKKTKAPEALPQTGAPAEKLLALGLLLLVCGGVLSVTSGKYQRQH